MSRFRHWVTFAGNALVATLAATSTLAATRYAKPLAHPVGAPQALAQRMSATALAATRNAWTPLTNQMNFIDGAANPILLTDGSVLVQDAGFPDWWKLTPDSSGSYVNGTWSQIASTPATYSPLYHSSAVLPDGRMIIEGGEYLLSLDQTELVPSWTAQGAIYDPVADTWTMVAPPPFFPYFGTEQTIGDAQSMVLADGTFMQANCCTNQAALLDPLTLTWTSAGTGKFDINDEEGWTLLPNRKVLAVDAYVGSYDPAGTGSELYNPRTRAWSSAGSTVTQLWDSSADCGGSDVATYEVGPGVLRPDGTVFYTGANACAAAHTAIYNSRRGTWSAGPDFPDGLGIADGPAALEPNGKVLMMASPGVFSTPSVFLEWDGRKLRKIPGPPNAPIDSSFFGNMLVLPTGQILLTDFSNDIEIYTPSAGEQEAENNPQIYAAPSLVRRGNSYRVVGRGFNGVSQGAAYGDDAQAATNFPLVRITNNRTGHVSYARTHDHSSMAVASEETVSTTFDVTSAQERGASTLEVVVNGHASAKQPITVQ